MDKITIVHEINELLFEKIKDEDVFLAISGKNCIISCKKSDYYTMILKNPIDEDDEELNVLFFTSCEQRGEDYINITCNCIDSQDYDDMNVIELTNFDLKITKQSVHVELDFNTQKYPSYMKKVIKECFEQIVNSLINSNLN